MKKRVIVSAVTLSILAVLLLTGYILIMRALNPQRIREIIYEYAEMNSVELKIDEISYRIALSGIYFNADGINFRHERAEGDIERISLQLDIFRLIRKEIFINRMILKNPDIRILRVNSVKDDSSERKIDLSITSNLRIEQGRIMYDSIGADSLYADIIMSADSSMHLLGNAAFRLITDLPEDLKSMKASFNADIGESVSIKHLSVKNKKFSLTAEGALKDTLLYFKSDVKTDEPEYFKSILLKNDSIEIDGSVKVSVEGVYNTQADLKQNVLSFEKVHSDLYGVSVVVYGRRFAFLENSSADKLAGMVSVFLETEADSQAFNLTLNLSLSSFFEGRYEGNAAAKNFDIRFADKLLESSKVKASGIFSASYRFNLERDSVSSGYLYLLKNGDAYLNFSRIDAVYDTFKAQLAKAEIKSDKGKLSGICKLSLRSSEFDVNLSGDASKNVAAVFSGSGVLDSFARGVKGVYDASGTAYYTLEKKRYSASVDFNTRNAVLKGISDTLKINLLGIQVDNGEKAAVKNIMIKGKHLQGHAENTKIKFEKGKISADASFTLDYLNVDSLLKKDTLNPEVKAEQKPIDIPPSLNVNAEGTVKKLVMKDETVNDIKLKVNIHDREFHMERMDAKMLDGSVSGKIDYYAAREGYSECSVIADDLVAGGLIKRQKLLPFDAGTVVDSDVRVHFNQHKIKETIAGTVAVNSKNGWLLLPGVISKVSETLHYPMNDTFYFEDMNGEFEIREKHVYFKDFYMEKNGHSLLYSGDVDFDKNMNIEGLYLIDMKISDTGILEKMLKSAFYDSDTIMIKFHLKGNYKEPKVSIYYSSIGEFLKKRTQENVDEVINKLNEMFKF